MKNIVSILISPLMCVFLCLLFVVFSKKSRKVFLLVVAIILYLLSIPYPSMLLQEKWKIKDTYSPDKVYDAVVVLAGVTDIGRYTSNTRDFYIPDDYFYTTATTDRLLAGVYFVRSGHAKELLFGNWRYEGFNESDVVRKYATKSLGLKPEQFVVYGDVERTLDEARSVRQYADKKKIKKILLVTSQSHMRRTYGLFKRQGLEPDLFSTNKTYWKHKWTHFFPSPDNIIYELIGYIVYYTLGDLK